MPIQHKFVNKDFGDGFETRNLILENTSYKPEVMIIGTFNPDSPNNHADFFYGRNFFWPAFKNLFLYNEVDLTRRRMPPNGAPPAILNPTIREILDLCLRLKLTFSDLVFEVLHDGDPVYNVLANDNIIFEEHEYNLIQDGNRNGIGGLEQLDNLGQVNWNTDSIIEYLCINPQIKQVYFTRRPTGIWDPIWKSIRSHPCVKGRLTTNIYTPSGAGKPVYRNMSRLLNHWVHNHNPNFGELDDNWLTSNGVTRNNFLGP